MPNRTQRRKAAKQIKRPAWAGRTLEQKQAQLYKNGITARDLEQEYRNGFDQGFRAGSSGVVETCYAGFCLALQDKYRFGRKRVLRALLAADDYICNSLTSLEIRDQVFRRLGLQMNFKEAFPEDRITEVKKE